MHHQAQGFQYTGNMKLQCRSPALNPNFPMFIFKDGWKRKGNQNQICACFHVKWKNIKNAWNYHFLYIFCLS